MNFSRLAYEQSKKSNLARDAYSVAIFLTGEGGGCSNVGSTG